MSKTFAEFSPEAHRPKPIGLPTQLHLCHDGLNDFTEAGRSTAAPVYLTLERVDVELRTLPSGGATVTLSIPRDVARELGMVPSESRELE